MNVVAIIPARMGSTRFPGKPMAKIHGMPMIGHVYHRTKMSQILSHTWVATCDQEIVDYVESIGGKALMTSDRHERCSDRTAEAMTKIEDELGEKVDIVVMVQGDEPMLRPEMIDQALKPLLEDASINITNLMAPLKTVEEHEDPNEVKVVVDQSSFAMYFSREPIPSRKKTSGEVPMYKQVCIIPFRRDFLIEFNRLAPKPLEVIESVDMLRLLESGYQVKMVETNYLTYSVDTPKDLANVERMMVADPLVISYSGDALALGQ